MSDIEKLPRLLARAVATLEKATTAAEILEAREASRLAYDGAKAAERLAKMKGAHDTVIAAIRKAQADALVIETRAQCRLADEYDAAQDRGEVQKHGGQGKKRDVPNENIAPTVTDIGLTRKQVHQARAVRDAEKQHPGIVRETLDAQLEAGKEPTRADVKRAVNNKPKPNSRRKLSRGKSTPQLDKAREIVRPKIEANEPVSPHKLQDQHDISHVMFDMAISAELARKEVLDDPPIDAASLSLTAQQKFDAAIRQYKRKLDVEFETRVLQEIRKRTDEMILPAWKKQIADAKRLYAQRKGIMDKSTFNTIRRALHPDSRNSISDRVLAEAFDSFMRLEKHLLSEKDSPTEIGVGLPRDAADWDRMRAAATAARKAKRTGSNVTRR